MTEGISRQYRVDRELIKIKNWIIDLKTKDLIPAVNDKKSMVCNLMSRILCILFTVFCSLFVFYQNLNAHKLHHPKVIIVEVNKNNIRVMINYIVNPGDESRTLRKRFDGDRDGVLSSEEQDELQKYLIKNILSTFNLLLNKKTIDFEPLDYRVENINANLDSSAAISIDIYLLKKNIKLLKLNELLISDFLIDSRIHVPAIVKFSADFEIQSSQMGTIVKKSNLIRDIDLERGKDVVIRFKKL